MNSILSHTTHILLRYPRSTGILLERGQCRLPTPSPTRLTKFTSIYNSHPRRYLGTVIGHERESDTTKTGESLITLAIETSCDDTCVAVLEKKGPAARLLFNRKITADSRDFGGIHPMAALNSHVGTLSILVKESLKSIPLRAGPGGSHRKPDFVSVTRGPGMKPSLSIGLSTAKGLAVAWDVPLVAVHHMQAHTLTPRLLSAMSKPWPSLLPPEKQNPPPLPNPCPPSDPHDPKFPFLTLLVSGGHTQLVLSKSLTTHTILADASDIALGDLLDKCARSILPPSILSTTDNVMFGAQLEAFAFPDKPPAVLPGQLDTYDYDGYVPPLRRVDEIQPLVVCAERGWIISPPLANSREMVFNFTGLGGYVRAIAAGLKGEEGDVEGRRLLARAVMRLAFEHVASRIVFALGGLRDGEGGGSKRRSSSASASPKLDNSTSSPIRTLVLSGGVASNKYLRYILHRILLRRGFKNIEIVAPPPAYCTDNAAMIAWTGVEMYERGWRTPLDVGVVRRWSMDPDAGGAVSGSEKEEDGGKGVGILDGEVYRRGTVSFEEWLGARGRTVV